MGTISIHERHSDIAELVREDVVSFRQMDCQGQDEMMDDPLPNLSCKVQWWYLSLPYEPELDKRRK